MEVGGLQTPALHEACRWANSFQAISCDSHVRRCARAPWILPQNLCSTQKLMLLENLVKMRNELNILGRTPPGHLTKTPAFNHGLVPGPESSDD